MSVEWPDFNYIFYYMIYYNIIIYIFSRLCVLAMHLNHPKGNKMTDELT